jgi:hypothetical protein
MVRVSLLFAVILAIAASACRTSRADVITLMDGTVQEGEVIREDKESITLSVQFGSMKGVVVLNRKDIRSVQVTETLRNPAIAEGAALAKAAEAVTDVKKAIEAWTKVADFYEKNAGFSSEAHAAYEKVLLLDPDNAVARARLGYVQTADGWAKRADLQRAENAHQAERAQAVRAKVAQANPDDDMVIGLRQDNALINKLQNEKEARAKTDAPPPPQPAQMIQQPAVEQYTGLPYYPTVLYGFGPGSFGGNGFGFIGNGFNNGFGYGGYGYGGYGSGFGYSNSYYNSFSGGSFGFHGKIGSVRVSGRFGF